MKDRQRQKKESLGSSSLSLSLSHSHFFFFLLQSAQLSVERQNVPRLAIIALLTCALVIFLLSTFVFLYFLKRNERIQQKLTHLTRIKRVPTDHYRVRKTLL